MIIGNDDDAIGGAMARSLAEAEVDILRVRSVSTKIYDRVLANQTRSKSAEQLFDGELSGSNLEPLELNMKRAVNELARLDRYERRAMSRRKIAMRMLASTR